MVGVCLDRDSSNSAYTPTAHVHMLGKGVQTIGLVLASRLRSVRTGAPDSITVVGHAGRYREAAERLKLQAPVPLDGPLRLDDVVRAYEHAMKQPNVHVPIPYIEDLILACGWAGASTVGHQYLRRGTELLTRWPAEMSNRYGGAAGWEKRYSQFLDVGSVLREAVAIELHKFGLSDLADAGLEGSRPASGLEVPRERMK